MPVAHINLLKGHERKTLQTIIAEVSEAMGRILESPKDRLLVWISEVDPALWGVAGIPAEEALAGDAREDIEMPFVQMALMENRPLEQKQRVIAEITEILHNALGTRKERIRVHVSAVDPALWGIGGVPASISRAREIEARRLQAAG
jgi:4-oxalocrotonate tautomerase family enzyme